MQNEKFTNDFIIFLKLIILSLWSIFSVSLQADTLFSTGQYEDNANISRVLEIPNAEGLEITVKGETEKDYDFLFVYNNNNRLLKKLSGSLDMVFTVPGSTIKVVFKSDGRTTKEGVTVSIAPRSPASIFNEIKTQLLEVAHNILREGTAQAYIDIGENLTRLRNLHTKIKETPEENLNRVIENLAAELIAVARTYNIIAVSNKNLLAQHQAQMDIIEKLKNETFANANNVEKRKQEYLSLIDKSQVALTNITTLAERQKIQYSIEGYKNIAQAFYTQQSIWKDFYDAQNALETKLKTHSEKIGVLLHFLKVSAEVYQQVANVALLRKTTVMELNNLTDLTELREVVVGIENSEREISDWIEKIKNTNLES